jgi:hypothetical protein
MFDQFGNKLEKGDPLAITFSPGMQQGTLLEVKDGRVVFAIQWFVGDRQFLPGVAKLHKFLPGVAKLHKPTPVE